jgi:hypothetical protein
MESLPFKSIVNLNEFVNWRLVFEKLKTSFSYIILVNVKMDTSMKEKKLFRWPHAEWHFVKTFSFKIGLETNLEQG